MWGVSTIAFVTGDGQRLGICILLHLLRAPIVPCSRGNGSPSLHAPAWLLQLPFVWGVSSNRGQQEPARVEELQAKPSSGKGRGGVGRDGPSPRLVLFEHCRAHFFSFSKHEVSLSFYSLSCLLSTTSNQMGSRDKTIKTQCLYLAGCQVCMPSKYLRQKNLNKL